MGELVSTACSTPSAHRYAHYTRAIPSIVTLLVNRITAHLGDCAKTSNFPAKTTPSSTWYAPLFVISTASSLYAQQRRAGAKGYGLFAEVPIRAGQFIIEYVGEVLEEEEYQKRKDFYLASGTRHYYFMNIGNGEVIDACRKVRLWLSSWSCASCR